LFKIVDKELDIWGDEIGLDGAQVNTNDLVATVSVTIRAHSHRWMTYRRIGVLVAYNPLAIAYNLRHQAPRHTDFHSPDTGPGADI
jgi:hypothetical protein